MTTQDKMQNLIWGPLQMQGGLTHNYPETYNCKVFYEAPENLITCTAQCSLGPYETQNVEFYLTSASPVLRDDHILITSQNGMLSTSYPLELI